MTIFGFNTNVERDGVTYHVESQARAIDLLLQTMIFLKGQCVGKHVFSYAAMSVAPDFSENAMHDLLKAQHKNVIEGLQHGTVDKVLQTTGEIEDVGGAGLSLKWNNSHEPVQGSQIVLHLQVFDSGAPASGAKVSIRAASHGKELARVMTDASGNVVISVAVTEVDDSVMAQAMYREKSATRRLRVRK